MAVNLSPVGGVAAQFFDNSGNVLTGGKLYTYAAGTTTPQVTYTTSAGNIAWSNPIILDAAGRVSGSGEIWLIDGSQYKFILRDSNDVLIATYDNVTGINSNFVNFTNQQEIQTATAGQTVFNLTTIQYQPGTNSLSVFVDGVNQYGPGAQYAYLETDADTVTFTNGLHVGAEVKFTTSQLNTSGAVDAEQVSYNPPFTGAVATNVEDKLAQTVSVKDFGAVGDGVTNDTTAIQNAVNAVNVNGGGSLSLPNGDYNYTYFQPDYNVSLDYEGPGLNGARINTASSWEMSKSSLLYLDGNHPNVQKANRYYKTVAEGSGLVGPLSADFGLIIDVQKENWTSATAKVGEIDGIYINVKNGTERAAALPRSDCASILSNVEAIEGTGFSALIEARNDLLDPVNFAASKSINIQILPINDVIDVYASAKYSYGIVLNAVQGNNDAAILIQESGGSGTWGVIVKSTANSLTNSFIQDRPTGDLIFKNENTGAQMARFHRALLQVETGTTYTIDKIADLNNQIAFTSSSPITVTCPASTQDGFNVKIFQNGSGKVTFVAASGTAVVNVNGQYKTQGPAAMVQLTVVGGTWYLSGDTSA